MSNDPFVQQVLDETRFERGLIKDASKYRQQRDELLAALREIEEQLFGHPNRDAGNSKVHYAWHKAKAAIAKATQN